MLVFEAIPPVGPVFVPALQALFLLAGCIVAIGIIKLVDAVSRAFFGTAAGAVGWVPYAGKLISHSLKKIEQRISHGLGTAERGLDKAVALGWHNLARLVHYVALEIAGAAESAYHLAQQARAFVRHREVTHEIRANVKPVRAKATTAAQQARLARQGVKAVGQEAAVAAKGAHIARAQAASLSSRWWRTRVNTRLRQNELALARVWRWVRARPQSLTTAAFIGATAWALSKVGAGWIRCNNWRRLGREVCRWPASRITSLLGLLATVWAIAHIRTVAEYAEAVSEEVARDLLKVAGAVDPPRDRFTIE